MFSIILTIKGQSDEVIVIVCTALVFIPTAIITTKIMIGMDKVEVEHSEKQQFIINDMKNIGETMSEKFEELNDSIDPDDFIDEAGKEIEIPAELQTKAEEYRANLIEAVADYDEELMMKYLEGEEVTEDETEFNVDEDGVIIE